MDESYASNHNVGLSGAGCASGFRRSRSADGHSNRRSQSPRVGLPSTSLRLRTSYELGEHASSLVDWLDVSATSATSQTPVRCPDFARCADAGARNLLQQFALVNRTGCSPPSPSPSELPV